jgi:hypothetical protein
MEGVFNGNGKRHLVYVLEFRGDDDDDDDDEEEEEEEEEEGEFCHVC